jgi:hypothetical protein
MKILPLVVIAVVSPQIRDTVRHIGRACANGSRPPEAQTVEARFAGGAVQALSRYRDGLQWPAGLGDVVVGDVPAETLLITGTWSQDGDIIVLGDGVLIVCDAELTMRGNIYAVEQATVVASNSSIDFDQEYIYQYSIVTVGASSFRMDGCTLGANGYPYNFAAMDSADVTVDSVCYKDFTTYALFGGPTLEKRHVNLAGEFVVMDSAQCTFVDVDTILIWHSMMGSSVIDFAFPPIEQPVYDWCFNDTVPGVEGVAYSVYCDSVYFPWWGMFSGSGSDVTIRDSEVRTCGIFFEGASVDTMEGFVNGMTYDDVSFPFSDRTLRFVNTKVRTISLYPWDISQLTFSSSIVGEVLSMDTSLVIGMNYYLDGTGGHIEASGSSGNVAGLAMITADALARDHGFLVIVACSQLFGHNWADGSSRLFLVQSSTSSPPVAYDSASVGYAFVTGPPEAPINSLVPITGSVWVDGGPHSTADLVGYRFFYERAGQEERYPIGVEQVGEVRDDTLIVWETTGLSPGNYGLILQFYDGLGDTLDGYSPIRLETLSAGAGQLPGSAQLAARQVGSELQLSFHLSSPANATLSLYDVTGSLVAVAFSGLADDQQRTIRYRPSSSGVYVARLDTPTAALRKRVTFAR